MTKQCLMGEKKKPAISSPILIWMVTATQETIGTVGCYSEGVCQLCEPWIKFPSQTNYAELGFQLFDSF